MKKSIKRAAVLGLSVSLALTALAGCAKKEAFDTEATAITVNDDTISAGVMNFAVRYNQAGYESLYMSLGLTDPFSQDLYGAGSTLGDDVKAQLATKMSHALLAEQKMGDYDVELTQEDKDKIAAAADAFVAANDEEVLEKISVTKENVQRYLELTVIQNKMEQAMSADIDTEVSDEEAAQRKVRYVLFTPESETEETEASSEEATEAQSEAASEEETAGETETEAQSEAASEEETAALEEKDAVKTEASEETEAAAEGETDAAETEAETVAEGETEAAGTEAETAAEGETEAAEAEAESETETETEDPEAAAAKERARVHAEEMLAKLKDGEEFDAAAEAVGKTANDLTFGADYSVAELVEATDGLADDTLIETPVETSNGYYVVKLVSQLDREATDAKKDSIVEERRQECISGLYSEWEEAGEVAVNDEVMAKITFAYHLVQPETESEAESENETAAEAETAAETESETAAEVETAAETEAETAEAAETEAETATEAEAK